MCDQKDKQDTYVSTYLEYVVSQNENQMNILGKRIKYKGKSGQVLEGCVFKE